MVCEVPMTRLRRVLCASDFSKASAKANDVPLTVLHVMTPFVPIVPEQYVSGELLEQLNADARRVSRRRLASVTTKARKAGVRAVGLIVEGDPARGIVRAVRSLFAGRSLRFACLESTVQF